MTQSEMAESCIVESPVGRLLVEESDGAITKLEWTDDPVTAAKTDVLRNAASQLADYFEGRLTSFSLPLAPEGTDHQKKVWAAMCDIPSGGMRTYGDLANEIGSSARAVGTACGKNPIPIIVPCHRILATGGGIGGYSGRGGTKTKRQLLDLEGFEFGGDDQGSLDLEGSSASR